MCEGAAEDHQCHAGVDVQVVQSTTVNKDGNDNDGCNFWSSRDAFKCYFMKL